MKTLLASGNVVLTSDLEPAAVKKEFEACLREAFGYDAWVVVLTASRVAELVEACHYPADDKATHTYITLASDTAALDELFSAGERSAGWSRPGWVRRRGLAGPGRRDPGQPLQQAVGQAEVQGFHHHTEPPDHGQGPGCCGRLPSAATKCSQPVRRSAAAAAFTAALKDFRRLISTSTGSTTSVPATSATADLSRFLAAAARTRAAAP